MLSEEEIKELLKDLPEKAGVYKFFDKEARLIYVGKAKSLKKRVSSYFQKRDLDNKTFQLVKQIVTLEYTIVNTEMDAYLLENNLIKSFQPKYNILLKDDKTYPYIYITKERYPKVLSTRKVDKDLGTYFGPYTSVKAMNSIIELLNKLYFLRSCSLNLSEKNIAEKKYKVCLEYHLGNCKGPCEGLVVEEEYNKNIKQAQHILKGNLGMVRGIYKEEMEKAAATLDFEIAHQYKQRLDLLDRFQSSSVVVSPDIEDVEVYSIASNEKIAIINFLKVTKGVITQTKNFEIKKKLNEPDEDILMLTILRVREQLNTSSGEIIVNRKIEIEQLNEIKFVNEPRGDRRKLLLLSEKNSTFEFEKLTVEKQSREERIVEKLQKDLQLKSPPNTIECFDNSNIQGTNPVAAMICFKNGRPSKKDYRHFNIKTVIGPNDFDSMHEIVYRRYKRLKEEQKEFPDLIIIDGGKGQLSAACDALKELELYGQIPIIGIAKRLEELFFPEDSFPVYIDKKSESLNYLQYIRNEAHRFAITFHRNKRSKSAITSELDNIPGIGEKKRTLLLKKFKSVANLKQASEEELIEVIGKKDAEKIITFLK